MARVVCPLCSKAGDIPDEFTGRRIRCPHCSERFAAPTLDAPPAVIGSVSDLTPSLPFTTERSPLVVKVEAVAVTPQTKACPFCAETIQVAAVKCRHCGEFLDLALRAAEDAKAMARVGHASHQVVSVSNAASAASAASSSTSADPHSSAVLLFMLGTFTSLLGLGVYYFFPLVGGMIAAFGVLQIFFATFLMVSQIRRSSAREHARAAEARAGSVHHSA